MQTQRITFTRTETITAEVTFDVDPDTRGNLESWANYGLGGQSPLDAPGAANVLNKLRTDWHITKAQPPLTVPLVAKTRR